MANVANLGNILHSPDFFIGHLSGRPELWESARSIILNQLERKVGDFIAEPVIQDIYAIPEQIALMAGFGFITEATESMTKVGFLVAEVFPECFAWWSNVADSFQWYVRPQALIKFESNRLKHGIYLDSWELNEGNIWATFTYSGCQDVGPWISVCFAWDEFERFTKAQLVVSFDGPEPDENPTRIDWDFYFQNNMQKLVKLYIEQGGYLVTL